MAKIINAKRFKIPEAVIANLEQVIPLITRLEKNQYIRGHVSWRVEKAETGITRKGMKIMLIHLAHKYPIDGAMHQHNLFAALDPTNLKVIAVHGLDETSHLGCLLRGGDIGVSGDFQVREEYRRAGVGSALVAHAIEHALKKRRRLFTQEFTNPEWQNFFSRIGFRLQPTEGAPYAVVEEKEIDEFRNRKKEFSYRHYLLRQRSSLSPFRLSSIIQGFKQIRRRE
ncbi:GNAT family N-acetyltransferase [Candidatus Micrarchaeota archaeon]|nr:GNAT family N-acetyltransferase [Candidatus Micrarchaeota archaeon]